MGACAAVISGCISYGPWRDIQPVDATGRHQYPWCAAHQALKAQGRTVSAPFATTSKTRYLACDKSTFDLRDEIGVIESRLVKSQVGASWKQNIFGKREVPFDIVLVSVTPTVLVLCEREEKGRFNRYPGAFDSKHLEPGIGFGPTLFCAMPTAWMGDEFEVQALESINATTKIARLKNGSIEISLTQAGGAWHAERN